MKQFVVCTVEATTYGFPIEKVREIIRMVDPQPMKDDTNELLGVINLRGEIVPIYDLANHLGSETKPLKASDRFVIIQDQTMTYGWRVDDVEEVLSVEDDHLQEAPTNSTVEKIINYEDKLVPILETRPHPAHAQEVA